MLGKQITVGQLIELDDAPRVAAGHLLKYKCTLWAEEQK
jgi:hypothetical protein